jgi:uncharacterized protein YndB with AHSA1/START domain
MSATTSRDPAPSDPSDREIVITREFTAPRDLVWEAMTHPGHVVHWWGPRGFRTEIATMDVRPGGVWKHTMIGPDGTRYPNKSIFRAVVRPERIVYSHGGGREDGPGASFVATWTFEALPGARTRVTIRMVFPSASARDFVVREFGAIEGGRQTLERLGEQLAARRASPFVITREFAAPRADVWRAWTTREALQQWFGPQGFTLPHATLDFRPGGHFHYRLEGPGGTVVWGKFFFREIVPETKLVLVDAFSDPAGGIAAHPLSATPWPAQMLLVITFAEHAGRTTVTLSSLPIDATDAELRGFDSHRGSLEQGWAGTLARLTSYLSSPTAAA